MRWFACSLASSQLFKNIATAAGAPMFRNRSFS